MAALLQVCATYLWIRHWMLLKWNVEAICEEWTNFIGACYMFDNGLLFWGSSKISFWKVRNIKIFEYVDEYVIQFIFFDSRRGHSESIALWVIVTLKCLCFLSHENDNSNFMQTVFRNFVISKRNKSVCFFKRKMNVL